MFQLSGFYCRYTVYTWKGLPSCDFWDYVYISWWYLALWVEGWNFAVL